MLNTIRCERGYFDITGRGLNDGRNGRLAEADRIDPVKTARFLEDIEANNDANQMWGEMWASRMQY